MIGEKIKFLANHLPVICMYICLFVTFYSSLYIGVKEKNGKRDEEPERAPWSAAYPLGS